MDMELYTWQTLGTFAGATAATLLVVQYLKVPLDKLVHIRTRILVLAVAFVILVVARAFSADGIVWQDLPLLLVNGSSSRSPRWARMRIRSPVPTRGSVSRP